jgi:hypothetical protein
MNPWRAIASICEVLPDNHPILVEREKENSQVNLFTDFLTHHLDKEVEEVIDGMLKELEGDRVVGGFTPRGHDSFMRGRINYYNEYIRACRNEETTAKIGVGLIFIGWTLFWIGMVPYAAWKLTEWGWPY